MQLKNIFYVVLHVNTLFPNSTVVEHTVRGWIPAFGLCTWCLQVLPVLPCLDPEKH